MSNEIKKIDNYTAATPAALLQTAVEQGADLDKLEKLMDLQDRWEAKEAKKAFADALARFQSELTPIIKKQVVDYTTSKGRTTFAFANIDDIAQQIRPLLDKNGLSYRFSQSQEGINVTVTCTLSHAGGHSEEATLTAPNDQSGGKNQIQALASTVTYLRRYTLTSVLGITTGDNDNDGGKPEITVEDLINYLDAVRELFPNIAVLKEALAIDDFATAKESWSELSEDEQRILWRAPTKGSILDTKERAKMKSSEWMEA